MLRIVIVGLWICAVTLAASYGTAMYKTGNDPMVKKEAHLEGLDYKKTDSFSVPVLEDGKVHGYIIAQFVYTVDAVTLDKLAVPPEAFVVDEAFRLIYSKADKRFAQLGKSDLHELTEQIRGQVNERFGVELIQDLLVQEFTFHVPKEIRAEQAKEEEAAQKKVMQENLSKEQPLTDL
ncbi:hypothetical protein [Polycladidibacter hongkongensis]|uniref:hypothetical protein n=1 Tax=Polycladidibacter hongkongensis TaxID=1647556 RepID=UPI000830D5DE|nr:hypothetical protein [Pseudovibrio hongkongensis]